MAKDAVKEVGVDATTTSGKVKWIGSPRKHFKGTPRMIDLRECGDAQLQELKRKFPSQFEK